MSPVSAAAWSWWSAGRDDEVIRRLFLWVYFPLSEKGRIFVGLGCNKMKCMHVPYRILAWGLLVVTLAAGCRGEAPEALPQGTPSIVSVTVGRGEDALEAVISCEVSSTLGLLEFGFVWDGKEIIPPGGIVDRVFSVRIGGLAFGQSYTYCAFIGNGRSRIYSEKGTWTTESEIPPVPSILKSVALPGSDAGLVRLSCRLPGLDGVVQRPLLRYGICYSFEKETPTLEDFSEAADEISPEGDYQLEIRGLTPSSTCYFRPYAAIGKEVSYGAALAVKIPSATAIVVTEGYDSFPTRVVMRGRVHVDWAPSLSAFGIEWNGHLVPAAGMDPEGLFSVERSGLTPGKTYSYRAYANLEGMFYYGNVVSFTTPDLEIPEAEYVDLGLGVLWAVKNLGAASAEALGDRYAWGETAPKTNFSWGNYYWCDGSSEVTKYNSFDQMRLLPEDDAATAALHTPYRMPTLAEWQELCAHCRFVYHKTSSMIGYIVTSQVEGYEDRSIFIPIEDYYESASYWTSDVAFLDVGFSKAYLYQLVHLPGALGDDVDSRTVNRCAGYYIRPVRER